MLRTVAQLFALALAITATGCAPPVELSAPQEQLVRRCLELAFKQEGDAECARGVTGPMQKAFLEKHPDFHDQLLAARKQFVEDRIAEDKRRRDDMNLCLDDREAGAAQSPVCANFMAHEITRGLNDRRLTRCATASLDATADASQRCHGLSERVIADEVALERNRRARRS